MFPLSFVQRLTSCRTIPQWRAGTRNLPGVVDPKMSRLLETLILICTLAGAILIGKWFQAKVTQARLQNAPWYAPYLSTPGAVIALAVIFPIIVWILRR
jgi:hypothetical protein